ncbi:MAG: 50S ribosomal protein L13 [Thermodesulfobacteriota bacterium]|nr:50S ribosomal protein L13 [Thermodesulfobacteriota bacterium]
MSNKKWLLIDAKGKIVGRLASKVASFLIGKNKPSYTPGADSGDCVIVINSDEVKFTGKKLEHKFYYKNTGYPGGLRSIKADDLIQKDSAEVLRKAVRGMLPKNKNQSVLMKRLKVYSDSSHPHKSQNPEAIEV